MPWWYVLIITRTLQPTWAWHNTHYVLVLLRRICWTPLSNFPAFSSKKRSSSYSRGWGSNCSLIESNSSTLVSPITSIYLEEKMQKFHSLSSASDMSENADRISSQTLVTYFQAFLSKILSYVVPFGLLCRIFFLHFLVKVLQV